jgi:hypothetical protein
MTEGFVPRSPTDRRTDHMAGPASSTYGGWKKTDIQTEEAMTCACAPIAAYLPSSAPLDASDLSRNGPVLIRRLVQRRDPVHAQDYLPVYTALLCEDPPTLPFLSSLSLSRSLDVPLPWHIHLLAQLVAAAAAAASYLVPADSGWRLPLAGRSCCSDGQQAINS